MIKIGNKLIREGKTFVVAEMSGNHNGKLSRALNIIKAAKRAGADAIKLQTYRADTITLNSNKKDFLINNLSKKNQWKKFKTFYNLYEHASTPWNGIKSFFYLLKNLNWKFFQVRLTSQL